MSKFSPKSIFRINRKYSVMYMYSLYAEYTHNHEYFIVNNNIWFVQHAILNVPIYQLLPIMHVHTQRA